MHFWEQGFFVSRSGEKVIWDEASRLRRRRNESGGRHLNGAVSEVV